MWGNLPIEQSLQIISFVTDISDINTLSKVSNTFRSYINYLENITSDNLVHINGSFLNLLTNLKHIDHKVIISIDEKDTFTLKKLHKLREAHFLIRDASLLSYLLESINGLNHDEHYFKISLLLQSENETIHCIIIKDKRYMIIPRNEDRSLIKIINECKPSLNKIKLPYTGIGFKAFALIKKQMLNFIKAADFGLVYPDRPPSIENPPLSNYIKTLANGCTYATCTLILFIYVAYNRLNKDAKITLDEIMKENFLQQIRDKYGYSSLDTYNYFVLSSINSSNILRDVTVDEIYDYQIPNFIENTEINNVCNILTHTHRLYRHLISQAKTTPNIFYYNTNGAIMQLS